MARTGLGSRADGLSNADYLRNLSHWANGRAEGGRGLFRRVPRRFPGSSRTIQLLTLLRFQPGALLPPSQERTHFFHFHPQHSRLSSGLRRASPFTTTDAENALQLPTSRALVPLRVPNWSHYVTLIPLTLQNESSSWPEASGAVAKTQQIIERDLLFLTGLEEPDM